MLMLPTLTGSSLTGSTTNVTSRGGAITQSASIKSRPGPKRSTLQADHTSYWVRAAKRWKEEVSKVQKKSWAEFGTAHGVTDKCGTSRPLPGRTAYMRSNVRVRSLKLPPIDGAPATWTATNPVSLTATWYTATPHRITLAPSLAPLPTEVAVIGSRSQIRPGATTAGHRRSNLTIFYPPTSPPWDVLTFWEIRYGTPLPGLQIYFDLFYCDPSSGCESPRVSTLLLVP